METILHKIYIGELGPVKYREPKSIEYWKQNEKVQSILAKWAKRLGENDNLDIFDEMLTIYVHMVELEREEIFQYGFHLAVKLMSEAYSEKLCEKCY